MTRMLRPSSDLWMTAQVIAERIRDRLVEPSVEPPP